MCLKLLIQDLDGLVKRIFKPMVTFKIKMELRNYYSKENGMNMENFTKRMEKSLFMKKFCQIRQILKNIIFLVKKQLI